MTLFIDITQFVIFVSYFVISCIVGYVYVRHRHYIDTCSNRLLLVTAGLFLILCAITHLYSIWHDKQSEHLLFLCALASFMSAVLTTHSFRDLDNYLQRRVTTMDLLREELVLNLTTGYDLKVTVVGNDIVSGVAGSVEISNPKHIAEGFEINSVINLEETYFRIVHIVDSFVAVSDRSNSGAQISDIERSVTRQQSSSVIRSTSTRKVYGYDATAEVRMKQDSERLNRMKMDMCMFTAHHVRTPLSCLGISLKCLELRINRPEHAALLDDVFVQYEIIDLVVRQFVDIATFDTATKLTPCFHSVDVRDLMRRVEKVLNSICAEDVLSKCLVRDGVPKFVVTDGDWLLQIILNGVANAARYTLNGFIKVDVSLLRSADLLIEVSDTGIGIPDREKSDVFDKNFANLDHGSSGVGLYSVKRKVSALGGIYKIIDNGEVTVLSVKIPVQLDEDWTLSDTDNNVVKISRVRSILLVDDTPSVRKLMRRFLKDHRVDVAIDGADGLEKMKEKKFDVVFLDLMMPVLDGVQCLTQFREWERVNRCGDNHQVIYCMSATSGEHNKSFDGSIPKPVDTNRLLSVLQNLE